MKDGTLMKNKEVAKIYGLADYVPLITIIIFTFGLSLLLTQYFTPNSSLMSSMDHSTMDHDKMHSIWYDSWIMRFMDNLMGIWFLIFALFKLIDLKGFVEGYSTYDIIAKKTKVWGYIYPFIEVILGIMYLTRFYHQMTNYATIIILGVASIGIIQSIIKKSKIQCLCLGTVLKVPLTKVSLIENLVMIIMALFMLTVMK